MTHGNESPIQCGANGGPPKPVYFDITDPGHPEGTNLNFKYFGVSTKKDGLCMPTWSMGQLREKDAAGLTVDDCGMGKENFGCDDPKKEPWVYLDTPERTGYIREFSCWFLGF
jgi:hypothetical protein